MRSLGLTVFAWCVVLAACSDPNPLPPANIANTVDTVALWAATGTPIFQPSGYAMTEGRRVRLDQSNAVDFAFDFRDEQPVLLPGASVGQPGSSGLDPGLQHTARAFADITTAEINGYVTADTLHIAPGDVFFTRSRVPPTCFFGLPTYGKLQILSIDPDTRTVRFQTLTNRNCGYKSLEVGFPTQ